MYEDDYATCAECYATLCVYHARSPFHPPLDGGTESTAKRETLVSAA